MIMIVFSNSHELAHLQLLEPPRLPLNSHPMPSDRFLKPPHHLLILLFDRWNLRYFGYHPVLFLLHFPHHHHIDHHRHP